MRGLEIGAGFNPIASKRDGWNVHVVDHASREALQEKYRDAPGIDVARIEDVDIVWNQHALHECVTAEHHHSYDYCLASHVVEHIPDLVTFLASLETLLRPTGILSLAVPDKRFSFDAVKPFTTTADILAAHSARGLTARHSAKTKYENVAYNVVSAGDSRAWGQHPVDELRIFSALSEARSFFDAPDEVLNAPYVDCHAWYFTPSSFRLLMLELRALGKTRFVVGHVSAAEGCEFFARLHIEDEPATWPSEEERLALLVAIQAEQAEQFSFISPSLWERLSRSLPAGHPVPKPRFTSDEPQAVAPRNGMAVSSTAVLRAVADRSSTPEEPWTGLAASTAALKRVLHVRESELHGAHPSPEVADLRRLLARWEARQESRPLAAPLLAQAAQLADVTSTELLAAPGEDSSGPRAGVRRALARGLRPLLVEAMRPQARFNAELVRILEEAATTGDQAQRSAESLSSLVNPMRWQVASHRAGTAGLAVVLAKRAGLKALGPLLAQLLEGQGRWNAAIAEMLIRGLPREGGLAANETDAIARSGELHDSRRLLEQVRLGPLQRIIEQQIAFNRAATDVLRHLVRCGPDMPLNYHARALLVEAQELAETHRRLSSLAAPPLISVITPAWETPEAVLRECLDSVLAQSYPHWELCIVDDGSKSDRVARVVSELVAKGKRVRFQRLPENGGIARATNAALELATGEFVAFLDHDDTLTPHALAQVALRVSADPKIDLLYSDEDKLDERGRRTGPFFKPDWSPDLLREVNYLCHLLVARRSLVTDVGGVREGFDGAQDYDLVLRLSEGARRVAHIPMVLYHWRLSDTSTAKDAANKPKASGAGRRALSEYLLRVGEVAEVEETQPTHFRVRYAIRGTPRVSIVIAGDGAEVPPALLQGLRSRTRYSNQEILLVSHSHASSRDTPGVKDGSVRRLQWDRPFNASAISNFAAREATGDLLLFLDAGVEVTDPGWLEELIGQAQRPEVGAVGGKLLYPNGTLAHAGLVVGLGGLAGRPFANQYEHPTGCPFGQPYWTRNCSAVSGACLMLRRELFLELNGFDERFLVFGGDLDLCQRVAARGLRIVYTPHAALRYRGGAPRRAASDEDYWRTFLSLRPLLMGGDPCYNPNLSLADTSCDVPHDHPQSESRAA
jgi:GT2 family glycosyltransferase